MIGEQISSEMFVGGDCFPLLLIDGDRPTHRTGVNRFVVPVSTLHKVDSNRNPALGSPISQFHEVFFSISKITLDDDPNISHVSKCIFGQNRLEYGQSNAFGVIRFHINVDEGPL